jgi:presenilin-like A22 family membrane protease
MHADVSIDRNRLVLRVALLAAAVYAGFTGVPATFFPRAFYDSFPAGLSWVSKIPPYNQHLVMDVGGFYLAFTLLFIWTGVTLQRSQIVPVVFAWTLAQAIHFVYHVTHLDNFDTADAVAQTASLAVILVLPVIALTVRVDPVAARSDGSQARPPQTRRRGIGPP